MLEIKEQTLTFKIDKKGSLLFTEALSALIAKKLNNQCTKKDCEDCKRQGTTLVEPDIEKLAKEIHDLYFEMYKVSMSTTNIPSLQQVREAITPTPITNEPNLK